MEAAVGSVTAPTLQPVTGNRFKRSAGNVTFPQNDPLT